MIRIDGSVTRTVCSLGSMRLFGQWNAIMRPLTSCFCTQWNTRLRAAVWPLITGIEHPCDLWFEQLSVGVSKERFQYVIIVEPWSVDGSVWGRGGRTPSRQRTREWSLNNSEWTVTSQTKSLDCSGTTIRSNVLPAWYVGCVTSCCWL